MEFFVASTLLRGNGLAEIKRDSAGRLTELEPIPWEHVSVQLLPTGRLAYDVVNIRNQYGGTGRLRRLLEGEVSHLRDRSDDGLLGRSRLNRAASVVSAALGVQEHAAVMHENMAVPSGSIEVDAKIPEDVYRKLTDSFKAAFSGSKNARKVMVLDQGMKFNPLSLSAEDAELLASRRFSTEELARLFGCPPPIIGDLSHGTFTNSETAGRWFATHTLSPWVRKLECEMTRSLLSESARANHEIEIDLSGLLRGDPESRWKSHEIAIRNEILTKDEVREIEGFNPMGGAAT
jgi:HK97 family phage portal protein